MLLVIFSDSNSHWSPLKNLCSNSPTQNLCGRTLVSTSSTKMSTRLAVYLLCPYHPKLCLEVSWLCPNKQCVQILLKMSNINLHLSHLVVGTIGWWQNVVGVREIIFAPGSCWVENQASWSSGGWERKTIINDCQIFADLQKICTRTHSFLSLESPQRKETNSENKRQWIHIHQLLIDVHCAKLWTEQICW